MAQDIVSILSGPAVLRELFAPDKDAARRFIEFFTANIRNPNTWRIDTCGTQEFHPAPI